jgi:GxxExxY protein
MSDLLLKDEVYAVVGAAMEVYWQLGTGFLEPVYQEALEIELQRRGIPFEAQRRLTILYKGRPLQKEYVADVVCYGQIIVELKAHDRLIPADLAQLLNYLKATGMHVGLLFNFGSKGSLEWKRVVL